MDLLIDSALLGAPSKPNRFIDTLNFSKYIGSSSLGVVRDEIGTYRGQAMYFVLVCQ